MIEQEAHAMSKVCMLLIQNSRRPLRNIEDMPTCIGSFCMAHWKWADEVRQEGYCSLDMNANDKPKIK